MVEPSVGLPGASRPAKRGARSEEEDQLTLDTTRDPVAVPSGRRIDPGARLRGLYEWTLAQACAPYALWLLALIAFVESSIFPIPPDILIIPMVLAARSRAWLIAGVATVASVAGGLAGYAIGALLFDVIGAPVLEFYGYLEKFASFQARYNEYGAWIVFGAGLTPFPYKVITIASGVTQLDLTTFLVASILARGLRFFFVAALLWWLGEPIRRFIEHNLGWLTVLFFVLLFGGFFALKLL
jgi:membrane protein YqaA with SNARE-associated domain